MLHISKSSQSSDKKYKFSWKIAYLSSNRSIKCQNVYHVSPSLSPVLIMASLKVKAVLTDIEGTTTSISFVKDVLFPYAKENVTAYLQDTWSDEQTQNLITELLNLAQYKEYAEQNHIENERSVANIAGFVNFLITKDLKLGPLKILQGWIWQRGYEAGQLQGHVYEDVKAAFERWQQAGVKIAIYSSGSVQAQKLLFGQSVAGNLLPYICAHFDTAVGHKQDSKSYTKIAEELNLSSKDIVFLTDIYEEAKAAKEAGMLAILLLRPGNGILPKEAEAEFTLVQNFTNLNCE